MDVKELRFGNWIYSYRGGFCKVLSIGANDVRVLTRPGVEINVDLDSIKPINMTIDLFERNNFSRVVGWKSGTFELKIGPMHEKYIGVFPIERCCFYVELQNSIDNRFSKARISFVHELQNLLQDFKIDKEIELWT